MCKIRNAAEHDKCLTEGRNRKLNVKDCKGMHLSCKIIAKFGGKADRSKMLWNLPAVQVAKNHEEGGQEHPYRSLPQDFEFSPPILRPSCQYHPAEISNNHSSA